MAIELGKFDPSRNIDERDLYCLVDAVYSFKSLGGNEKYKNENISIGLAFERFLYPVLSKLSEYDRSFNFEILFIGNKCLTSGGKERTPSLMTFCRRMGLVIIGEAKALSMGVSRLEPNRKTILKDEIINLLHKNNTVNIVDFNIDDEESAFDTLGERELGKFKLSDFED